MLLNKDITMMDEKEVIQYFKEVECGIEELYNSDKEATKKVCGVVLDKILLSINKYRNNKKVYLELRDIENSIKEIYWNL